MQSLNFREWLQLQEASEATRRTQRQYLPRPDAFGSRATEPAYVRDFKWKLKNPAEPASISSVSIPADNWWQHTPDGQRPAIEVHYDPLELVNVDKSSVLKTPFRWLKSNTMPGDGWWSHQPDNRPNIEVVDKQE